MRRRATATMGGAAIWMAILFLASSPLAAAPPEAPNPPAPPRAERAVVEDAAEGPRDPQRRRPERKVRMPQREAASRPQSDGPAFRLQLTIVAVEAPTTALFELDAAELAQHANSASEVIAALAKVGTVTPRARMDQIASPGRPVRAEWRSEVPYVHAIDGASDAPAQTVVSRREDRLGVELRGYWDDPSVAALLWAELEIMGTVVRSSQLPHTAQPATPVFGRLDWNGQTAATAGAPLVLIQVDGTGAGATSSGVALVTVLRVDPIR